MAEQGNKLKKIFGSKMTLFLLSLGFLWLSVSVVNVYYKKFKINKEINDLKAQIASTEKSNQQISQIIDYLSSPDFLEKTAKEKLNMKKPGEEVVIIEPAKSATTSPELAPLQNQNQPQPQSTLALPASGQKEESNFVKWWRYFFR